MAEEGMNKGESVALIEEVAHPVKSIIKST